MPAEDKSITMPDECTHPYEEVIELTVDARYANKPLNRTRLDFCTACGAILDVEDADDATLTVKSWANSCDHPFSEVNDEEIEIVEVGSGKVLQTISLPVCTNCDGPVERTDLELNFRD